MSATYCQCGFVSKAAASLRRKFGSASARPKIEGACPHCGLLPKGDRVAEYVLTIWFTNGETSEFTCRGSRPEERFRVADGTITVNMAECRVIFSLSAISTIGFRGGIVPLVAPVPPEVAEAERIIKGPDKPAE
jgi:hypothetical protein